MSKITVVDARATAKALTDAANQAEASGETEFDLSGEIEEKYAQAKAAADAAVASTPDEG